MSQLSKLFHRKTDLFKQAIQFLEEEVSSISGEQKAKIVVDIMKALHVGAGGVWGPLIEAGVVSAIDFVLAEIRAYANPPVDTTGTPPPVFSIYDNPTSGPLPDEATLYKMGFGVGDQKLVSKDKLQWMVTHPGGVYNIGMWDSAGFIGS